MKLVTDPHIYSLQQECIFLGYLTSGRFSAQKNRGRPRAFGADRGMHGVCTPKIWYSA